MMVEAGQWNNRKEMLDAIMFGHEEVENSNLIEEIVKVGKPKSIYANPFKIWKEVEIRKINCICFDTFDRAEREKREDEVSADIVTYFDEKYPNSKVKYLIFYTVWKDAVRDMISTKMSDLMVES